MTALAPLTERVMRSTVRDLDLLIAVVAPVAALVGFTLLLRNVIDTGGMSYTQYVLPAAVVQAVLVGALTTADRAAREKASGFGVRLRTMPIPPMIPLAARMVYCLIRGVVVLVAAIAAGYVMGFRMTGGFAYGMAFVAVTLLFAVALSLGADAIGTRVGRIDASSQLLLIPQLLLVLLSTGMAPAESFPGWLQPFVRYQPVSQVTETLRGFTTGKTVAGNVVASLAWCVGLLVVFGMLALRMQKRANS